MPKSTNTKQQPTISVVIPLHHEGRIFYRTSRALQRAVQHTITHGYSVEIILVLDRANERTIDIATASLFADTIKNTVVQVDYGNPGMTRNHGVSLAQGKYVALIDGDNLFSENWLTQGISTLESKNQEGVVHPHYLVAFGASQHVWKVIGSDDPTFDPYALAESNYWDTMCITHTSLVRRIPHDSARTSEGLGYKDWHWNGETLAAGAEHYIAPETSFFYRAKEEDSMLQQYTVQRTLMPPTSFLQPEVIDAYHKRTKQWRKKPEPIMPEVVEQPTVVNKPGRSALLWTVRKVGKPPYSLIRRSSRMHHRARDFNQGLQPLLQHLVRPPGLPPAKPSRNKSHATHSLPSWLVDEWRQMHEIEPSIFPSKQLLPYLPRYSVQSGIYSELYWKLAREIGANVDYLVVVPWLKKGGADKEVLNYVQAIVEMDPDAKVVVLATNNTTSPWKRFLPKSVTFLTMDKRVHELAPEHQTYLLGTLFTQLRPKRIHVINSPLGYMVLRKYAQPISKTSKLFLLIFCLDHTDEGQKVHYVIQYLEYMFPYLTKVFADNQKVIDELIAIYNFDPQKFSTHYQPFPGKITATKKAAQTSQQFSAKKPLQVLWAGRLDWQKRPDLLLNIHQEAVRQGLPVDFHVYGSAHLSGSKYLRAIKRQPGITYHGPYDKGLETLPLADYDLFMLTSQWEGLPNVMLEATAGQLPILAPAAGGIAEFIAHQKTGYLVEDFDDVDQYITALKYILSNYHEAQVWLTQAQTLVKKRHSWKNFKTQLQAEDAYIDKT